MTALFTTVQFIDLVTDQVIEDRWMPIQRLQVASMAHARKLATLNRHAVLAWHEDGLTCVQQPAVTNARAALA